jgi:transmembrane sensor
MARSTGSARPWSEEATHWWTLLHGEGVTTEERREFLSWVSRSPERIEAYLGVERLMAALHSHQVRWPDTAVETLIRDARASTQAAAGTIAELGGSRAAQSPVRALRHRRRLRPWLGRSLGAALAAIAAAVVACWLLLPGSSRQYVSGPGEQRSVMLADGSRVTLNYASSVAIDLSKHRRIVRLLHGEALFQVSHDPARPFDVYADGAVVRAIGTVFNVDLLPKYAALTVLQGRVAVMSESQADLPVRTATVAIGSGVLAHEHPRLERFPAPAGALILGAAQQMLIGPGGLGVPRQVSDPAATTAWTRRQLVFEHRPLGEVVDELDRDGGQRIVIDSATLRARQVTGVIQLDDPQSLLEFLSDVPGVVIRKSADGASVVTLEGSAAARSVTERAGRAP